MRKFFGSVDIVFTKIYTGSLKYAHLPFCIEIFSHFVANKGYCVERSNLNCYIILYCIKGVGKLECMGKKYTIEPNQVAFIDCSEYHKWYYKSEECWKFYFMLISGSGVEAYYNMMFKEKYYMLEFFEQYLLIIKQ